MLAFIFIVAVSVIIVIAIKNLDPSSQSESTPTSNKSWEERFTPTSNKSWEERFIEAARNNQNDLARKILRKGAEAGDIYCMETLALYYSSDIQSGAKYGILPNSALSIFWYRRAADAGSASAMMSLSYAYSLGEGVEADEDKAFELMKRAADQGFPEHELHLRLAHPGFQLRNHFARDEVPLMHVGAVNVAVEVTAGKQGGSRCESKKGSAHGHGK